MGFLYSNWKLHNMEVNRKKFEGNYATSFPEKKKKHGSLRVRWTGYEVQKLIPIGPGFLTKTGKGGNLLKT